MDIAFRKLSQKIGYEPTKTMQDVKIIAATSINNDCFDLHFLAREFIPVTEMKLFLTKLNNNFMYKSRLDFDVALPVYSVQLVYDYFIFCMEHFMQQAHSIKKYHPAQFEVEQAHVTITFKTQLGLTTFQSFKTLLLAKMAKFGFKKLKIKLLLVQEDILKTAAQKNQVLVNQYSAQVAEQADAKYQPVNVAQKRRQSAILTISEAKNSHHGNVIVKGEIFKADAFVTKTGWHIITLAITDYEDAIYVKLFANNAIKKARFIADYTVGTWISANGEIKIDNYSKESMIAAKKVIILKNPAQNRIDDAAEKRVELSTRTKMSAMDGLLDAQSTFKRAQAWGHKAVAFMDQDSVQAFPDIYQAAQKYDVKPIYGAIFSVIERQNQLVLQNMLPHDWENGKIKDSSYVVFDLETTGLSPIRDQIIEFGATKIVNGLIVERKQFFLQATDPLSEFTKKLTGISDQMVQQGYDQATGIRAIRAYLDGMVVVAHNAQFDLGFVHQKIAQFNLKPLHLIAVDSLVVARFLETKAKRFRLENVANRYGIVYDSTVAHRADYDAEILARIWKVMMKRLSDLEITTFGQLEASYSQNVLARKMPHEVTIIAKNQAGLKELFQLISLASTKQYFNGPRLFKEALPRSANLIIGSASLRSKLVDLMLTGTTQKIAAEIKHYDYIEVQPPLNFRHLIHRGQITMPQLQESIKELITIAKAAKKLVVATGDVRYLDAQDAIYHEVYINSKGLGGKRHYLFRYHEQDARYPQQYFLTTLEMKTQFAFLENVALINEIVVVNSNLIAAMTTKIEIIKQHLYTPKIARADEMLSALVYKNARAWYGETLPQIVAERIKKELEAIIKYGYGVIYWIAHKLVAKSLRDGYLVGSRGSVGSSLVATLASITEVNPLLAHYFCRFCRYVEFPQTTKKVGYDLVDKKCPNCGAKLAKDGHTIPFETFLGFEGEKVPDIDLNFSGEYQALIHQEVKNIFGATHSFRAGTISTVAERTAFGYVKAWSEERAKNFSNLFIEFLAKKVQGTKRTTGQHPGGIIVIPKNYVVEDFSPINYPANDTSANWQTTHFDFHAIHDNVLKLDLLGHDDPTAIKMLERLTGVNALTIPNFDPEVIALFSSTKPLKIKAQDISGETTGVMGIPEFGTKFVRGMLKTVQIKSFQDLVSVSGLSHGTDVWSNNGDVLIKTKHLSLSAIISCRDDIMVDLIAKGIDKLIAFQIMERVRKGRSLSESQEKLMRARGVEDWYIDSCKKIKYMFPKAHATAYVKMAWRIAWYKINFPLEFYATYFTTRADVYDINILTSASAIIKAEIAALNQRRYKRGLEKLTPKEAALIPILEIAEEMQARGFKIAPINLEKSQAHEWIIDAPQGALIPPFTALDGLGKTVAESIIEARRERLFSSIQDLKNRTSLNTTNIKKLVELKVLQNLDATNQISFVLFA